MKVEPLFDHLIQPNFRIPEPYFCKPKYLPDAAIPLFFKITNQNCCWHQNIYPPGQKWLDWLAEWSQWPGVVRLWLWENSLPHSQTRGARSPHSLRCVSPTTTAYQTSAVKWKCICRERRGSAPESMNESWPLSNVHIFTKKSGYLFANLFFIVTKLTKAILSTSTNIAAIFFLILQD